MRTLASCLALGFVLALALSASPAPAPVSAPNPAAGALVAVGTPAPGALCPRQQPAVPAPALGAVKLTGTVDCGLCPGDELQCDRFCARYHECEGTCEADASTCQLLSCTCGLC